VFMPMNLFRFDELEQHCIPRASFAKLVRQIHDEVFPHYHNNFQVRWWCVKNVVTGVVECVLVTIWCCRPVFCALCCCVPVACSLAQTAALHALQAAAEAHLVGALRDSARCAVCLYENLNFLQQGEERGPGAKTVAAFP